MRMTVEERERKFRATFESHNLDRFFAFAQDLMCDCSAADYAQTVWMNRERILTQALEKLLSLYDNSCTADDFSEQWIKAIEIAKAVVRPQDVELPRQTPNGQYLKSDGDA